MKNSRSLIETENSVWLLNGFCMTKACLSGCHPHPQYVVHDGMMVVSDECELISVWRRLTVIMQHKAAAIRQVQRCVEP